MSRALGYAIDHPEAIAARTKPANWDMALLAAAPAALPADFDLDCGPVLDQDGVGACVAFSATSVRQYQERIDAGTWDFNTDSAFVAYDWLKHGHDTWPGDGAPNVDGSWPLAVWTMAKQVGIPDRTGAGRLISAYYQLKGTPGDPAWIETQMQVIYQYGPVTVAHPWPNNWWSLPSSGYVPFPQGLAGAHQYVRKGWTTQGPVGRLDEGRSPTGRYWRCRNSWGSYGSIDKFYRSGQFLTPFEADGSWYVMSGTAEVWKTIDLDEYPEPEVAVKITDPTPKLVTLPQGRQVYAVDGTTPLTKMSVTAPNVYSPAGGPSSLKRYVVITTGGVRQQAVVDIAGLTFMPYPGDVKHAVKLSVDGTTKYEESI